MLSDALRLIRVFHDMSQKELAEKVGISNSYISEIEAGKKIPTLDLIEKYAATFKMPASSILFFSEKLDSEKPSEKTREYISKKIIKILEWISTRNYAENAP